MKTPAIEKNIGDWMTASVTGGLNPEEQREFEAWLLMHPEARAAYEETQAMNKLLEKTLKEEKPDPAFEDRMVVQFRRKVRQQETFLVWISSFLHGPKAALTGFAAVLLLSLYIGTTTEERELHRNGVANMTGLSSREKTPLLGDIPFVGRLFNSETWNELSPVDANSRLEVKNRENVDFDGFINYGSSISDAKEFQFGFRADVKLGEDSVNMGLEGMNTYTGATTLNAGALSVNARKGIALNDGASAIEAKTGEAEGLKSEFQKPMQLAQNMAVPAKVPSSKSILRGEKLTETKNSWSQPSSSQSPAADETPSEAAAAQTPRKLIRNANVGMEVKSYSSAAKEISELSREQGGYMATQNDRTQANGRTAGQIIVKLPPDKLEPFVLRLRDLGTIKSQVMKTDDVTKAYFDTDARLRNARRTEERLLELMSKKTDKVSDLLQVEKEIGRVRESIEQMQGELKLWDSLASLATVTLDIVEQDLNRAAAYLLKEEANLSLYAADVEKSYAEARDLAEKSEAQVLVSQINRDTAGGITAHLSLLVAPEKSLVLVEQLKKLGRVSSFTMDTQRVAQDGNPGAEVGTTRRDKVEIHLEIAHDDASRKTVNLQMVTTDVEKALDAARKSTLAANGEILKSNLQRNPDGHASAFLQVRLPSDQVEGLRQLFSSQGRVVNLSVQRNDPSGTAVENEDSSPVILLLNLSDEEPPVQVTRLSVQGEKVAERAEELKKRARELKAEVKSSTFVKNPDGREQASLVFRLSQRHYEPFLQQLQSSGKTLNLALQRQDRTGLTGNDEGSEPVEIVFHLVSAPQILADNNGVWASLRHTLGKSFGTLMKSIERIATGFASLLPWLLLAGMGWVLWKKFGKK